MTRMDEDDDSVFTLYFNAASFNHELFDNSRELYTEAGNYTILTLGYSFSANRCLKREKNK